MPCDASDYSSEVVRQANEMLWRDSSKNEQYGVMLRVLDILDNVAPEARLEKRKKFPRDKIKLVPGSFVHASMRAPNPLFLVEGQRWAVG